MEHGRLIGRITLRDIASEGARLGIVLEPGFTGQGYGREALAIFCRHIFHSVGLAALWLDVASDNQRAIRCYVASGFRVVGTTDRGGYGFVEMERRA
jgi:RimJ/RimL family protein N-acetyltransferase